MVVIENVSNLRAILMQAIYERIVQNQRLLDMFTANPLPFDMYRIDHATGRRMRSPHMMHMVYVGYYNLHECLINEGDVDSAIEQARSRKEGDMYEDLLPAYQLKWLREQHALQLAKEERARADIEAAKQRQTEQDTSSEPSTIDTPGSMITDKAMLDAPSVSTINLTGFIEDLSHGKDDTRIMALDMPYMVLNVIDSPVYVPDDTKPCIIERNPDIDYAVYVPDPYFIEPKGDI
jgi:hypothetical protein